jgi:low affinity Fe/Cu permease
MKHLLTQLGVYASSPVAFLLLILYAALWYVFKPETFEWHAGATLATWAMTLVIQRAEHRDTQAIHAKLDEVLHALGDARNEITRIDEKEPEEIERRREHMRKDDQEPRGAGGESGRPKRIGASDKRSPATRTGLQGVSFQTKRDLRKEGHTLGT